MSKHHHLHGKRSSKRRASQDEAHKQLEDTLRRTGYYAAKARVKRYDEAQEQFIPGTRPTERQR